MFFDLSRDELAAYRPEIDEPADFDAFWTLTIAQARDRGGDVQLRRVDTGLRLVDVDDVTFPGFEGEPIKAWLIRPAARSDALLPAIVQYQGYNSGRGLAHEWLDWATAGYAHLVMDTRGQGSGWGSGGDTPDPHGSGPSHSGWLTQGIADPHDHFYRRVFTDAVRAVDAARTIDGIDPDRIVVAGGSQGGGITIAAAALSGHAAAAMPDVPFLCNFRRAVEMTDGFPYHEIVEYLAVHRDHVASLFRTLSYMDGVNMSRRATVPALFSVALMDPICPPSTVYSAFNHWAGDDRDIDVYEFNQHEGGGAYRFRRQLDWLAAHGLGA